MAPISRRGLIVGGMAAALAAYAVKPETAEAGLNGKVWGMDWPVFSQLTTRTCGGYALKHWLLAEPNSRTTPSSFPTALDIYGSADLQAGMFTVDGIRRLQGWGLAGSYAALGDLGAIKDAAWHRGPLVIETPWYAGFDDVGPVNNTMQPTRGLEDSLHICVLLGYKGRKDRFVVLNSRGQAWGNNGRAFLPADTLGLLLGMGARVYAIEKR